MKKVVSAVVLLAISTCCYSQSEKANKKFEFGFNFGINRTNLIIKETPITTQSIISNKTGFEIGLLINYKFSKIVSFSPQAEISFNNANVNYYCSGNENIMPRV